MRALLRHGALLLVAAWVSWWFVLRVPPPPTAPGAREPTPVLKLLPVVEAPEASGLHAEGVAAPASATEPEEPPPPPAQASPAPEPDPPDARAVVASEPETPEPSSAPPPGELGTPEGSEDEAPAVAEMRRGEETPSDERASDEPAESTGQPVEEPVTAPSTQETEPAPAETRSSLELPQAPPAAPSRSPGSPADEPRESAETRAVPGDPAGSVEALMRDPALLAAAQEEFERGNRKGFATVLLAAPEEQIEIARFFGEELVLVPRAALDPAGSSPRYFRIAGSGAPRVEEVEGAPPLEGHRQYRDLFDYEYARLPLPLRELRRSLVARGEVYLFAALLSASEWALIIARRAAALELAGRDLAEVRRFVLRYVRRPESGFDLRVEEIVFADGTRFSPGSPGEGDG